ncbi:MAG: DUF1636 domain-containing protein [Roseitalea porphyridii]|uniref:DUF1636 domain-containing protein n=2 Tax=Roseitalea porphyridii TaxID=1852022 RepID=UPI0032EB38CE
MSGGERHGETIRRPSPPITVFALRVTEQAMGDRSNHKITICVSCRHKNGREDAQCRPGLALIARLRNALALAGDAIGEDFEISGTVCMAGCDRPCTVAFFGSHKATYLFGDIDPDENIEDLVAFARQYASLADGWCSSTTRPPGLSGKTLARVPAALLVTEAGAPVQ